MDETKEPTIVEAGHSAVEVLGFSEEQAQQLAQLTRRFLASYALKKQEMSDKEWLKQQLLMEIALLTDEEAERLSGDCVEEISAFSDNLHSLNEAVENGGTKERWFAKKVQEASVGISIHEFGVYLANVECSIQMSNMQMQRVITNINGGISQSINLDGFIAEQHHVNTFNMNAKLQRSPYIAEVMVPGAGQMYGKNSFDVVIRDSGGKIVHQYQMKYGATAQDTIRLIRSGNYNNQRIVVPSEQLAEVRSAFPGKSIESFIGSTDKVQTSSQPLTKQQAKDLQKAAQSEGRIVEQDWNHFQTKELVMSIAANAGAAGIQAAAITVGLDLARKAIVGDPIRADETIGLALRTGADAGVKAAVAGAVHTAVEKGMISIIPKATPIGVIANVVCVGIENVKILGKIAAGELTASQGLDHMGRTTTAMVYGLGWGSAGAMIGSLALSWIPVAGPIVGAFVGGMVAYSAGSRFGEAVYETAKKVMSTAKKVVTASWETVKGIGKRLTSWLNS